jgi:hypothetical protein
MTEVPAMLRARGYDQMEKPHGRSFSKQLGKLDQYGDSDAGDSLTVVILNHVPVVDLRLDIGMPYAANIRQGYIAYECTIATAGTVAPETFAQSFDQAEQNLLAIHRLLRTFADGPLTITDDGFYALAEDEEVWIEVGPINAHLQHEGDEGATVDLWKREGLTQIDDQAPQATADVRFEDLYDDNEEEDSTEDS